MDNGIFRKGKKRFSLADIHGVQLIVEKVVPTQKKGYIGKKPGESHFKSYEINLIFKDASRVNVVDHGGYEQVDKDAKTIAKALNVPYWNEVAWIS